MSAIDKAAALASLRRAYERAARQHRDGLPVGAAVATDLLHAIRAVLESGEAQR